MRILVQNCQTKYFLQSRTAWVAHEKEAMKFDSSSQALFFCLQHHIGEVHILLKFGEPQYDVCLRTLEGKSAVRPIFPVPDAGNTPYQSSLPPV